MVVVENQIWNYWAPTEEPNSKWREGEFTNQNWKQGPGGIGYGDDDDGTIIDPTLSVYMHASFEIKDDDVLAAAVLLIDYDDGFIAYLNGVEIARSGFGQNNVGPSFDTPAENPHEAQMYSGGLPEEFVFDSTKLKLGTNHLAIQVHNNDPNSSDLSSRVYVGLGLTSEASSYLPVPNWFEPPFSSSNLPLVFVETNGQSIIDDPRIVANLRIVNNGNGQRNHITDPGTDYDGLITIEFRGSTSQGFPKKPYGFETQDAEGENNNVSLLGMPAENDWVLHNPYSDKSLIRNVIAFDIARLMGRYAPRTAFCEVFVNDEYKGVYVLMEKIKRDDNRVNITELDATMNEGDALTGGYMVKIDKFTGSGGDGWQSPIEVPNWDSPFFQFSYPKFDEITAAQSTYIESIVTAFESALNDENYTDEELGYRTHIDVSSFIDMMIIQELSRNVDAYRLSTYLYKDRDSNGGKLHAGPMWDFNLAFGNANYNDASEFDGWAFNSGTPFWWQRFQQDPAFNNEARCRWEQLRSSILSDASIAKMIADYSVLLEEAQKRNFVRWPILNEYVWPNNFVGGTYASELEYLNNWIQSRIRWLDMNFPGNC